MARPFPTPRSPSRALLVGTTFLTLLSTGCSTPAASDQAVPGSASDAAPVADSVLMARGLDLIRTGNGHDAAQTFLQVLRQTPTHYGAQYQLGRSLDLAGRPEDARPEWEKTLKLALSYADTTNAGLVRARLAQPDTLSQDQRMTRGLDYLYRRGSPAFAVAEFSQVIERNPTHYGAHYQLAKALDAIDQPAEAKQWWTKVVTMAEAMGDRETADTARARLLRPVQTNR